MIRITQSKVRHAYRFSCFLAFLLFSFFFVKPPCAHQRVGMQLPRASGVMQSLAMNFVRGSKFGKSAVRTSTRRDERGSFAACGGLCFCRAKASRIIRKKATRISTRGTVVRRWAGIPGKVRHLIFLLCVSADRYCKWTAAGFVVERAKIPQYIVPDLTGFEACA
jgi:hypothetical protein